MWKVTNIIWDVKNPVSAKMLPAEIFLPEYLDVSDDAAISDFIYSLHRFRNKGYFVEKVFPGEKEHQPNTLERVCSVISDLKSTVREQENKLKAVAKFVQESKTAQPTQCVFGGGTCGYPIDDCYNCPVHSWNIM